MVDAEVRREGLSMLVSGLITSSNGLNNSNQLLWVIQVRILVLTTKIHESELTARNRRQNGQVGTRSVEVRWKVMETGSPL